MSHEPMLWADHLLAVILTVLFPIRASTFGYRRLALATDDEAPTIRLALYRQAILLQWSLAAAVIALWAWRGRPWQAIGLVIRPAPGFWIALAVLVGLVGVIGARLGRHLRDPEALASVRRRLQHVERMLPHDRRELSWFLGLSATAGACEELLYRGYLIWYFGHWMGFALAAVAATLLFGFGHLYQGPRGIVTTSFAGAMLVAFYWVSGSLVLGMLAHALADMYSGALARAALAMRESEAHAWPGGPGAETPDIGPGVEGS